MSQTVTTTRAGAPTENTDWIDVLCRLESHIGQLNRRRKDRRKVVETVKQLMVELIEVADRCLESQERQAVYQQTANLYEQILRVEQVFDERDWGMLRRLIGGTPSTDFDSEAGYQNVRTGIKDLIRNVFILYAMRMDLSVEVGSPLNDGIDVIIADVDEIF